MTATIVMPIVFIDDVGSLESLTVHPEVCRPIEIMITEEFDVDRVPCLLAILERTLNHDIRLGNWWYVLKLADMYLGKTCAEVRKLHQAIELMADARHHIHGVGSLPTEPINRQTNLTVMELRRVQGVRERVVNSIAQLSGSRVKLVTESQVSLFWSDRKGRMADFVAALSNIVGLQKCKLQLRRWAKGMIVDEWRRALGLSIARRKTHMAFIGNPGTGKTMVARVLAKFLFKMGILRTDKMTEVDAVDLVGHTGSKTMRKIQEAKGGILLIEAYKLTALQKIGDKDNSIEALEEIIPVMDRREVMVIFAGCCEINKCVATSFYFDDFSPVELAQILHLRMGTQDWNNPVRGFKLDPTCNVEAVAKLLDSGITEKQRRQMNGGLIEPLLVNARDNLDQRVFDCDCVDEDNLTRITEEDLEAGLRQLSQCE